MNALPHVPTAPLNAYAGDVTPTQAWEALAADVTAQLVDVRTIPEWQAGSPDLSEIEKTAHYISLKHAPDYAYNSNFLPEVAAALLDKETPIYFMCKGGGRSASAAAALTELGYKKCYNIIGGFEGKEPIPGWRTTHPWGKK